MNRPTSLFYKTPVTPSTSEKMPSSYQDRRVWQDKQRERGESPRCGREACGYLIKGEVWVNKGTPLLYCGYCAMLINRHNPGLCSPEVDRLKPDPLDSTDTGRPSLDSYQLPPGSASTVDSTATTGSALTSNIITLGSALTDPADSSLGSALTNSISVDVAPIGSAINESALAEVELGSCGSALAEVDTDGLTHGSALTSNDNEADITTNGQAVPPKRIPGVTEPYKHVGTREKLESALVWFITYPTRAQLSRLHLRAGVCCADLAKKRGIFHGLCDERGMKAAPDVATHVGFTAGDEEEMED